MILARDGKKISHHTILRLSEIFDGTRQSLMRKAYTPRDLLAHRYAASNRKNQWDYIVGHLYCMKQTIAEAHADLVEACEFFGWDKPMTLDAVYHISRKWKRMYRPKELEDKKKHYEKWANYAKAINFSANDRWQIDEFQFGLTGRGTHETIFYGVVCVDRAFQLVRYVELSLSPINKVSFMRCWKGALLGNPKLSTIAAKPLMCQCDNAKWHEPELSDKAYMDFRQSAFDLNITIHWNDTECPQQDNMVENWIKHFKEKFVAGLRCFVEQIAPAQNAEDWAAHLESIPLLVDGYGNKWNTRIHKDGQSRLDLSTKYAVEDGFKITPEEIDAAVRITEDRIVSKYGVIFNSVRYHRAGLGLTTGDKLQIRVRPEGAGPDVEAYVGGKYLGRLKRADLDPKMNEKLNASYKREIKELSAKEIELRKRFLGYDRQVQLKKWPPGSRQYNMILAAMEQDQPGSTAGLNVESSSGAVPAMASVTNTEDFDTEIL